MLLCEGWEGVCITFYEGRGFLPAFSRFLGKRRALLNIKAMRDTTVLCLNRENFEYLSKTYTDFVMLFIM